MYVKKESEYQNHPFVISILEDLVGGLTIGKNALASTDELKAGALVGKDANGLGQVVKTAKLHADAANTDTDYQVEKGHEFKVGDVLVASVLTGSTAYAITAIDTSNADYDVLTVGTTLGIALSAGDLFVEADAVNTSAGEASFKYEPIGFTLGSIDLSVDNQAAGVLVRGTVKEDLLPYPVDDTIKGKLSLIRFE